MIASLIWLRLCKVFRSAIGRYLLARFYYSAGRNMGRFSDGSYILRVCFPNEAVFTYSDNFVNNSFIDGCIGGYVRISEDD